MSSISVLGTGSGLDLSGLARQLVQAERAPLENRLNQREARFQSELSALGRLRGALAALRDAASGLQQGTGLAARRVVSSRTELFSASVAEGTAPAVVAIEVLALAEADKRASQAFAAPTTAIGSGQLNLSVGEQSFTIHIAAGEDSLAEIRDAINRAPDNQILSASLINESAGSRLIFSARSSGAANTMAITVPEGQSGGLEQLRSEALTVITAASDARVAVDGFEVTAPSNRISSAIDGVSLDLRAAAPGEPASLRISEDRSAAVNRFKSLIDRYNSVVDLVRDLAGFDPASQRSGPLQANATVRSISAQLRSILSEASPGALAGADTLAAMGVTTDDAGRLQINQTRLDALLDERPQAFMELLAGEQGLAGRLNGYLSGVVDADGLLARQRGSLETRLSAVGRQREALDQRMEQVQARYARQFAALDSLIAQLNTTSQFLDQQLKAINPQRNRR